LHIAFTVELFRSVVQDQEPFTVQELRVMSVVEETESAKYLWKAEVLRVSRSLACISVKVQKLLPSVLDIV